MTSLLNKFNLSKTEKIYLIVVLLLFICRNFYKILFYPIFIDEALTFNWFTSQGIISSIFTYPEPNNHILYSLLTNLTYYLPFDAKINLRLPNLFIGVFAIVFVYFLLRSLFDKKVAIIPHVFFTFSYVVTLYSIVGRGYMLVLTFSCVCFYCTYKLNKNNSNLYLGIFSLCSVLGFYSVPSFLYISATFIVYLIILYYRDKKMLLRLFCYYLLVGLAVATLYSPIIVFNGLDAITNNSFTRRVTYPEIINYFKDHGSGFYDIVIGIRSYFIFIPFALLLVSIYFMPRFKKYKPILLFIFCSFLLPFVFIFIHGVVPNPRIWSYLIFPFVLGLALIIQFVSGFIELKSWYLYTLSIPIILFQIRVFDKTHPVSVLPEDYEIAKMADFIMQQNFHTFYFHNKSTAYPLVIMKYHYTSRKIPFYSNNDIDKNYFVNIDSIPFTDYDCIVYGSEPPHAPDLITRNHQLVYEQGYVKIYAKRN